VGKKGERGEGLRKKIRVNGRTRVRVSRAETRTSLGGRRQERKNHKEVTTPAGCSSEVGAGA